MRLPAFFILTILKITHAYLGEYSDEVLHDLKHGAYLMTQIYCAEYRPITDLFHDGIWHMKQHGLEFIKILRPSFEDLHVSGMSMLAINHTGKEILVAFRGSYTLWDWIVDFIHVPVPYEPRVEGKSCPGNCQVHKGIYDNYKKGYPELFKLYNSIYEANPGYQTIVTGHALGGGYAYLFGLDLQLLGHKPKIITFGGLRTGNTDINEWYDELLGSKESAALIDAQGRPQNVFYRVVQEWDVVPDVPPGPFYTHPGLQFRIDDDSTFYPEKRHVVWDGYKPRLRDGWPDWIFNGRILSFYRFTSHLMYFRRMFPPCLPDSYSLDGR